MEHLCASLGGDGWRPRLATHEQELEARAPWAPCGQNSETEQLRRVLLAWPGNELLVGARPQDSLLRDTVNLDLMRAETEKVVEAYERLGVHVELDDPPVPRPPNYIFMRDLFFMTPSGAIVARMASEQRAGEERHASAALARAGVPIVATIIGDGHFEGADALWMGPQDVIVGVGFRTNTSGFEQIRTVLGRLGITTHAVPAPKGVQHLLGCLNFLDKRLAAVRSDLPEELQHLLSRHGVETIKLSPSDELTVALGMNFVSIRPREVLMPAGCPRLCELLRSKGVACHEVSISQYVLAAGGLGCLTGIVHRAS